MQNISIDTDNYVDMSLYLNITVVLTCDFDENFLFETLSHFAPSFFFLIKTVQVVYPL